MNHDDDEGKHGAGKHDEGKTGGTRTATEAERRAVETVFAGSGHVCNEDGWRCGVRGDADEHRSPAMDADDVRIALGMLNADRLRFKLDDDETSQFTRSRFERLTPAGMSSDEYESVPARRHQVDWFDIISTAIIALILGAAAIYVWTRS